jgi:hypothetical protein
MRASSMETNEPLDMYARMRVSKEKKLLFYMYVPTSWRRVEQFIAIGKACDSATRFSLSKLGTY